ncbi:hypothetical protein KFZ70_02270 [Tamlana fucoidanivorans]|uniref:YtxH domain-containing protein n=1 Tax=Allotamlana fucoidanivorans TaxID=2583814 RepID=A0A5C4SHM8_9FLAO|nr:hypothetical protein [Tamlana fucoidanivorans]TNJ42527.1 hypothetical protein FGF67_13600 [Tamlana fucoidanivorans]
MKNLVWSTALLLMLGFAFTSCRENKKGDDVNITIEKKVEATPEEEGTLEEAGKAIDNAVKEVKEAGEATKDAVNTLEGDKKE